MNDRPLTFRPGDRVRVELPPDSSNGIALHDQRTGTVKCKSGWNDDHLVVRLDDPYPGRVREIWEPEYPASWLRPLHGPWRRIWDEFWPIARWGVWPASYALVLRLGFELGTRA